MNQQSAVTKGPAAVYNGQAVNATNGPPVNDDHAVTTEPANAADLATPTEPKKELNILILGETGVGKSTMINGFINYITYETLEEAEAGDILTLIPSSFTIADENFEEIEVKTGTDNNEIQRPGQSATQSSRVYSFPVGNTTVRLVDTPGIGDTRGIEQDEKNFENILATISSLNELHGICILLKPNNSRLTVTFRFCIKELLKYLHRDATQNIVFCFTNSRGTFYRPGDTMQPLKALLSENQRTTHVEVKLNHDTVYCFDNEAYRFLAAVKNNPPVIFSDDEREDFRQSWEKSISETKRLLEHIQTLPPHSVKTTVNLNHAREQILKMARPLAEISRMIQANRIIVKEQRDLIDSKKNIKDLTDTKMTNRMELQIKKLDYPKTVCTNKDCVKIWTVNGVNITEYIMVCHDHCYLEGVQRDSIGDPKLMNCRAMYSNTPGYCSHSNCGHHYREHLHIYYDSIMVVTQVENQAVKESLQENLSAAKMKEKMLKEIDALLVEYREEIREIKKAAAIFAYFLKETAITPYNDAMEVYLDHLISEEQDKMDAGAGTTTRKTLTFLKKMKEKYRDEKVDLAKKIQKGEVASPQPADVGRLANKLKIMKHTGKNLREALDYVNHAGRGVYDEATVTLQAPSNQGGTTVSTSPVKSNWFKRLFTLRKAVPGDLQGSGAR